MTVPLRAIVVCAIAPALAGCGRTSSFDLLDPAGPIELLPVPGEVVDFAWKYDERTYDADAADDLRVIVYGEWVEIPDSWGTGLAVDHLSSRRASYVVPDGRPTGDHWGTPLRPGVHRLTAAVWDDGDEVLAESIAPGLLVMQGAEFSEFGLTFTADVTDRKIRFTTVTASAAHTTMSLTAVEGGPRYAIWESTMAGVLEPVHRVVTFTGRTIDDIAIPPGDYRAVVHVTARGGTVSYDCRDSVWIRWQP